MWGKEKSPFPRSCSLACKMGKSGVLHRVGVRLCLRATRTVTACHQDPPLTPGPEQGAPQSQTPRCGPPLPASLPACLLSDPPHGKGWPALSPRDRPSATSGVPTRVGGHEGSGTYTPVSERGADGEAAHSRGVTHEAQVLVRRCFIEG